MDKIQENREFMKAGFEKLHNIKTDQMKKLPQPSLQKPYEQDKKLIDLIPIDAIKIVKDNLVENILNRKSRRNFNNQPLSMEELSFLLWASQGVKQVIKREDKAYATLSTVPSAGARHAFETYILVHNVENLEPGVYRYLAIEHKVIFLHQVEEQKKQIIDAALGQKFVGKCAAVLIWTAVPYRSEWRYHLVAHKLMLLDAGHVCQNLYLACEGIGVGTCAIAAYDQKKVDELIKVDGKDEFTIYLSPVGKI